MVAKMERARADVLYQLLKDPGATAEWLLGVKAVLPKCNVSHMVTSHPQLMLSFTVSVTGRGGLGVGGMGCGGVESRGNWGSGMGWKAGGGGGGRSGMGGKARERRVKWGGKQGGGWEARGGRGSGRGSRGGGWGRKQGGGGVGCGGRQAAGRVRWGGEQGGGAGVGFKAGGLG